VTSIVRLAVAAMATRFELVLGGSDPVALRAAEEAVVEIEACGAAWNRFRPDSEISRVNRAAASEAVPCSWDFVDDARGRLEGRAATDGAFDPTAGSAEGASWRDVALDVETRRVRFLRPGVRLDFGALAKGAALDRAVSILKERA
jgi:thiamine biosynthesis lipoprotein